MEIYLLKFAACSSLLFLFYKLLLEKEEMHVFKRFYLPGSLVISALIPMITFHTYLEAPAEAASKITFLTSESSSEANLNWLPLLLWSIYAIGVVILSIGFIKNLSELLQKIKENPKIKKSKFTDVLLHEKLPPHTFWSFIFLNKEQHEKKQIPREVYLHEQTHALQKHSFDILFIELLQVVLWFFPLIYLIKRAIKLNHEFLADKAVLKQGADRAQYQQTLLAWSSNSFHSSLVNPISYLSIKKRFTVMKKRTSKTAFLLRTFLLAPMLLAMVYGFSSTEIIQQPVSKDTSEAIAQERATPEMIEEYNRLARQYKEAGIQREDMQSDSFKRMRYIYRLMTPEQREQAESFPPPPAPMRNAKKESNRSQNEERKASLRFEREAVKEERKAIKEDRKAERLERKAEKRELEMERMRKNGEVPPPPPPPAPPVQKDGEVPPPPPVPEHVDMPAPPPPASPVETFEGWIEEGAEFYLNEKKVSGQEALQVVKKNTGKNLHIRVKEDDSGKTVKISTKRKQTDPPAASKKREIRQF